MDDGTAVKHRLSSHAPARAIRPALRGSAQPHHRRRRAAALVVVAVVALVLGAVVGAGAHGSAPAPRALGGAHAYFARLSVLGGSGAGSFAAVQQGAETAAINRTFAYTPYVRIAGAQHREIALTFDDGPGPYTPEVLSELERAGVPATFFEVGIVERYFHASTTAIAARGYPIGDHTYNHYALAHLSARDQKAQLLEQIAATHAYGAPYPHLFRPPYGSWNDTTLKILRKLKLLMILWTVDTSDYRLPGVSAIVHAAVAGARPGAIILMHDAGGNRTETVTALPKIIRALRARHYKLVTVPRLLLDNPAPRNQQIASLVGSGG